MKGEEIGISRQHHLMFYLVSIRHPACVFLPRPLFSTVSNRRPALFPFHPLFPPHHIFLGPSDSRGI
jgi:hypothetical protein